MAKVTGGPPRLPILGPDVRFRFGVIMAGSAPLVSLDLSEESRITTPRHVVTTDSQSMAFDDWPESNKGEHVIAAPTLYVYGLRYPGIERHRKLRSIYYEAGTTRLVEWDGDHRIPIKTPDVDAVVAGVLDMAREAGVLEE
jgi:hypothetical protein